MDHNYQTTYPPLVRCANKIESILKRSSNNIKVFDKIAYDYLAEIIQSQTLNVVDIYNWISLNCIPNQPKFFAQLPITLHYSKNFVIDMYCWTEDDTDIHDHSFLGAFCALEGETLQITYTVQNLKPYKDIYTCSIEENNISLLDQPDKIVRIAIGQDFVHKTVHLSPLCITLCIRTCNGFVEQYGYYSKGIAKSLNYSEKTSVLFKLLPIIYNKEPRHIRQVFSDLYKTNQIQLLLDLAISYVYLEADNKILYEFILSLPENEFKNKFYKQILILVQCRKLSRNNPLNRETKLIIEALELSEKASKFEKILYKLLDPEKYAYSNCYVAAIKFLKECEKVDKVGDYLICI